MAMVEVLRVSPDVGRNVRASTQAGGWSLQVVPTNLPVHRRKEFLYASASAFILAVAYLYPWFARTSGGGIQLCWFHRLTGLPCLLCGMTRSLAAAARLDLGGSFYFHLLGPFFFLFLVVLLPSSLALLVTNRHLELRMPPGTGRLLAWFLLAALAAALVLKLIAFGINV
jgi:hypothetical protein